VSVCVWPLSQCAFLCLSLCVSVFQCVCISLCTCVSLLLSVCVYVAQMSTPGKTDTDEDDGEVMKPSQ